MRRSLLNTALIVVMLCATPSCSITPTREASPTLPVISTPILSPIAETEIPISPLLQSINALKFTAGETTIGELNQTLGNPSSINEDWAGIKEYRYTNLQVYGFSSLSAFVDPKHGDIIEEILLGSELGNNDLVFQLRNPEKMMMIVPAEDDNRAHYVPAVINVILWYPQHGLFLQITCNSIRPSDCRRLTGEGFGFLYLTGKNLPVEALKTRFIRDCPECSVIELPWEGFAKH